MNKDRPGISPNVIVHRLSVPPGAKAVKQKRRGMSSEKLALIDIEVQKLLSVY